MTHGTRGRRKQQQLSRHTGSVQAVTTVKNRMAENKKHIHLEEEANKYGNQQQKYGSYL